MDILHRYGGSGGGGEVTGGAEYESGEFDVYLII